MLPIATYIAYFHICPRKLWLYHQGIQMEHTSQNVAAGKQIHQSAYPQRNTNYQELIIEGSKIDYYDPKRKIVHEIKKSNKKEAAHIAQLKYYLYLLHRNKIAATGILEYPKLRKTVNVTLEPEDISQIENTLTAINVLLEQAQAPPKLKHSFCRTCSYYEYCWIEENE
jgi:CRISPR-associated exonuclease Cas4